MGESNKSSPGGCLCGAVRFEVQGPSLWRTLCYCRSCCLSTGAPAVAWACFNKNQVQITAGSVSFYESSVGVLRGFCGRCGTTLTYERESREGEPELNARPQEIFITVAAFDDPCLFPPEEHVRYVERIEWFHVEDDLPRHREFSAAHGFRQHQKSSIS